MTEEYKAAKKAILAVYGHPEKPVKETIEQLLGLKQEINLLVADLQGTKVTNAPDGSTVSVEAISVGVVLFDDIGSKPKVTRRRG